MCAQEPETEGKPGPLTWCRGLESSSGVSSSPRRVPALPVKNLNGTGPVHPALAGEVWPGAGKKGGAH